ncbi:DUF5681 domain-containing protein [Aeromonas hydrophila]|uniref:DUF5681 domain-containing protein n=1 Tax=Aeromonas hydrophila TaxID=644 RepID=UPI003EC72106
MAKFKQGQSGNPGGRPVGSLHRTTLVRNALAATFEGGEAGYWRAVAEQAKAGCTASQSLIADRLMPKLRPAAEPVAFDLAGEGFTDSARSILVAVSRGEIDPQTGKSLIDAVAGLARVAETDALQKQLDELAARVGVSNDN